MELQKIINKLIEFRDARNWGKYHTGMALSHKLQIEAAEVAECFEWGKEPDLEHLKEELGDVLIITAYLCDKYGFDPITIANEKINKNNIKYPVDYQNSEWR